MTFSNDQPTRFQRIKLALIALGLAIAGVSVAQFPATSTVPPQRRLVLEDGLYLFGESPERGQDGKTYAVFSVANNQTVGAFYQPRSSFHCFSGQISPNRLSVDVVDSYDQTIHPYTVEITAEDALVAGKSAAVVYALDGFHQIEMLTSQDAEILAVCQADFEANFAQ